MNNDISNLLSNTRNLFLPERNKMNKHFTSLTQILERLVWVSIIVIFLELANACLQMRKTDQSVHQVF